ncbi:FliH/SctL family protein [Candidatus Formimonas warabiya]|uniref:FliH/SctL family protein n=1 Tax=Formimonas warabiya TaxID=1761012 RepID=UPI001BE3EAB5|nr:FliH/SctL family protein [Candidatus Formimonas warabiya]
MSLHEVEKEKNFSSSPTVVKSWTIEEDAGHFVLAAEQPAFEHNPEGLLEQEVSDILAKAKLEAQSILDSAYRDGYQQGQKKGHQEGYAEGFRKGEEEGLKKTEESFRQALEVLYHTEKWRKERIFEIETEIKRLAVSISEKIIHTQLTLDDHVIIQIAKTALDALVNPKFINVYVNPKDGDCLMTTKKKLSEELKENIPLKIVKNPDLPPGSCWVETDKGTLDASVNAQILELRKTLEIA